MPGGQCFLDPNGVKIRWNVCSIEARVFKVKGLKFLFLTYSSDLDAQNVYY